MFYTSLYVIFVTFLYFSIKKRRWFYIVYKTLRRDLRAALRFVVLNFNLWLYQKNEQTVPKVFTKLASIHPNRVAFYFEGQAWTYADVEKYSNKVANFFKKEGFKRGDTLALLLESQPEYVCIWLGLAKIGVVTALINSNLIGDPLIHSVKVSDAKAVIYGTSLKKGLSDISGQIPSKLYEFGQNVEEPDILQSGINLSRKLENEDSSSPSTELQQGKSKDNLIFIYTSGTTGLPKAAIITNMRYAFMTLGLYHMTGLTREDILYDALPLYHSAGGIVGVGQSLLHGVTVVIRKKFSASNFWKDCAKYNCTAAQYIGEICRYILVAHSNENCVQHSVKKIIGNGLRSQIWKEFITKFNIKEVYEFYGSTEGNSNLINIDSRIGSVGFIPRYASFLYPLILIKYDEVTGEPLRNKDGFCIRCSPEEPGMLLGIVKTKSTINEFLGYADKKATEKKLVRNVFKKGDIYFNSGDVLVQDEFGYFYFKDRTGDTFRWKGENVATAEVEAVISNVVNLSDAVVYGVEVPETEGRAGMAAIVDASRSLKISELAQGFKKNLPSYAIPIFIRVMHSVPLTGTFKLKKGDLQKEGFNVDSVKDQLYIFDAKNVTYVELTKERYNDIITGKIRL